jgi:hypothetical protein
VGKCAAKYEYPYHRVAYAILVITDPTTPFDPKPSTRSSRRIPSLFQNTITPNRKASLTAAIVGVPTAPKSIANASEMGRTAKKIVTALIAKMQRKTIFSKKDRHCRQRKG